MINLTKLSNAELNKRLAELYGRYPKEEWSLYEEPNGTITAVFAEGCVHSYSETLDYCSSWADIGPVIGDLSNRGYLVLIGQGNCSIGVGAPDDEVINDLSPTRALTICAIMVLEQEGE